MNDDATEWMGFIPDGTILGKLTMETIYCFYDRPVLFSCKDADGLMYLAVLVDEEDRDDIFFFLPISKERLQALYHYKLDLHTAFRYPEGNLFGFKMGYNENNVWLVNPELLTDEFLPKKGEWL